MKAIIITVSCLAVTLTACAKNSVTENTESSQTLRIAAAANLSDVLPKVVEGYKTDNNQPDQEIEITYASSGKPMRKSPQARHTIYFYLRIRRFRQARRTDTSD